MTFRNKVIVLSLLCILYLLFSTLYYIRASRSATIQDDDVIIDFDQHWRNALDDFPAQIPLEPLDEEPAYEQPQNEEEQVEAIETIEQQPKSEQPEQQHLSDEKYLTFFTHSGFQNQLIQVENGILLAWYLNRTLILPRALLGEAFGWSFFSKLQLEHTLRDPPRDESMTITDVCSEHAEELMFWDLRCPEPSRFVVMPFDEIFDLDWAKQHVRIVLRERSDFEWLEDKYGIKRAGEPDQMNGSYVDGDILFFKGGTRYDWRIFDTPRKNNRLYKYADSLDIFQLRERQEKLIHFSSLFGTGKLPIRRPEHYEFRRMLQRSITYKHPAVLALAEQVVNLLGGAGNYIGLHVRSGDGWFVKALPENVRSIVSQIGRVVESRQMSPPDVTPIDRYRLGLQQCLELSKTNNMTIVFMATDARFPRMNKAFAPLWNQYPCTFTIEDILPSDSPHWQILDAVKDPRTGGSLRKFLLPLVDASVAGRGWFFIGSEGSTFSGYIYRLHDVFWSDNEKQRLSQDASSSP